MRQIARGLIILVMLALPLTAAVDAGAQQRPVAPPHAWIWGAWIGGIFPPGDVDGPDCFGNATVIFTRDVVMRVAQIDAAYRQRLLETVAEQPKGLDFRFSPAPPIMTALGPRMAPDAAFGCASPDTLRVERTGPDEIIFPNCSEFPSPLRRCRTK